jgi:hypothetical protein
VRAAVVVQVHQLRVVVRHYFRHQHCRGRRTLRRPT